MAIKQEKPQYSIAFRDARLNRGYNQVRLAKVLGISNVSVCNIEKGLSKPSFTLLEKLAENLNYKLTINFEQWEH